MQALADTIESPQLQSAAEPPVVLRADGLRKSFGGQVVVDGVDAVLRRGEVVLMEGENGSGKTTLINILTGHLQPDSGSIIFTADAHKAEFRFPRPWISRFNPFNRFAADTVARHGFGRTWQDVRLFDSMSLSDNIAVAGPNQAGENPLLALMGFRNGASSRDTAEDTLKQLGLDGREQSSGGMISLGQSKRVAIARAVAAGARVLFLDEPLAGLDRQGIYDVLAMLSELVERHHVTLVIVEHVFNQGHLKNLLTSNWHLENGKLTVNPSSNVKNSGMREQPHWFQMLADASLEVITEPLPRGAKLTRFRIADHYEDKPVLEVKDLVVKRGKRTVIGLDSDGNETGFNLTINKGEIAVIQAPNGWGKSSLFDALFGLISASAGEVQWDSKLLSQSSTADWYEYGIRYLNAPVTGFNSFRLSELNRLRRFDPVHFPMTTVFGTLSGGQKQRVMFPEMHNVRGLLLDEPFTAMDLKTTEQHCRKILNAKTTALISIPITFL